MLIPKQEIIRDEKYRRWVASLPCLCCGGEDVQCAHIRKGNGGGMGIKPSDKFCVPLCVDCHAEQGNIGELKFWYPFGGYERAGVLAKSLYENRYKQIETMREILKWKRNSI